MTEPTGVKEAFFGATSVEFLNSGERLGDPAWLDDALERWGIPAGRPLTRNELAELTDLRERLRARTAEIAETGDVTAAALAELNGFLERGPVLARLEPDPEGGFVVEMTPVGRRWIDRAVRELAGSYASMLRQAHPPRVKLCANERCRAVFFDASRNRSRRWCDGRGCGNRLRVERFRARRR